ncbi:MAG: alpha-2-macroglobulin family protein, partial [Spirochaetota bacterium]
MKHIIIIAMAAAALNGGFFPTFGAKGPTVQYTYTPEQTRPGYYGEITIGFDKAVIPLSDIDAMTAAYRKKLRISFAPPLAGELTALDNRQASFRFTEAPRRSTSYTVTVNAAEMRSVKGEKISAAVNGMALPGKEFFFETPRIAVNVRSTGEHLTAPIIVEFTMPVTVKAVKERLSIKTLFGLYTVQYDIAPLIVTNIEIVNEKEVTNIVTSESGYLIQPKGLSKATKYTLSVGKDILPVNGNLGMKNDYKYEFTTYQPLKVADDHGGFFAGRRSMAPDDALAIRFNNDLAPQDLRAAVRIEPNVKVLDVVQEPHALSLRAEFEGDRSYTVTLRGLKDVFGQTLEKYELSLTTHGIAPWHSTPRGVMIMERSLPQLLPIKVCNMEELAIDYTFLPGIEGIHANLTNKDIAYEKTKPIAGEWKRGQPYTYNFNIASVSGGASGLLLYSVRARARGTSSWTYSTGRVFVTDIALTAKFSTDEVLVFARSLKDNRPITGAAVFVGGVNRGRTGTDGIARIRGSIDADPVVSVTTEKDIALNFGQLFDDSYGGYYDNDSEYSYGKDMYGRAKVGVVNHGDRRAISEILPFIFTERYLYRPGDTVEVKGIVRHRVNDAWQTSAATNEVGFTIFNSRDEEITNYRLRYDDWGSLAFSIPIPADAPTGYYKIQYPVFRTFSRHDWDGYKITSISFRVEDFKPATAEMKIIPGKFSYVWGDTFSADVLGWYLFGAPIIKPIKYSIEVESEPYESSRYPEYSFGEGYYYDDDYGGYRSQRDYSFTLADETVTPPADGKIRIKKEIVKSDFKGDASITLRASTTLEDKSTVYGAKSGILVRNPVHVGLKTSSYFIDAGKNAEIGLIALGDDERIVQGQNVNLSIDRHEWKSFQQAGVNGLFGWQWREVVTSAYKKDVKVGNEMLSIPIREPGFYRVRARYSVRGHEHSAARWFYVLGKGDYGWRIEDGYSIDLESDKKEYQVGDTARILVKNPYKEALVLTSTEREKIFDAREFTSRDSMIVLTVPITAEHIPNVYVSAMLFTGRTGTNMVKEDGVDPEKPRYRMGYINLPVVPREKKLTVTLTPSRENFRPRDEVSVAIRVSARSGAVLSEITIAAVDKGVLNLVNYRMPDPLEHFYASRRLAVSTSEVAKLILGQRYLAEKGEVIGGDGGAGFGMITPRSDFKSTVFYKHTMRLEKGEGSVTFTLPDNLTTFTVMAVAHTKRSEFGYGEASFTVGQPLMILSSLPRFVRAGDRMSLGATVHNYTGKDAPVTVVIEADEAMGITGPKTKTVKIAQGASAEVLFDASVSQSRREELPVTIKVKAGDNTDGLLEKIPLREPDIPETVAIYEKTGDKAEHTIALSDNVRPGLSRLSVALSPSAFSELTGSVDYLVHYPYGCLEQKSSSILPLITGEDVILKQEMLRSK